jgi:prepilin-type N-terminal cleavage/methylation domain-containing protein/prepilin-type processing-associated H-X9-DG protein
MVAARRGFTLIELVVVVTIIGILLALLLPAIQRIRASAMRTQCGNNLKQIGLGAHQYHDTNKVFPAGMRLRGGKDPYRYASWLTFLLPYVEQQALWAATQDAYRQTHSFNQNPPHVGLSTVVPLFTCPADSRAGEVQIAEREKIPVALTSYLGVEGQDLTTLDGVLFRNSRIRIADITDGTSNTLFAGERPPSTDFQFGWWYGGVGQRFTGSAEMILGVREQNVMLVTVGSCPPGTYSFGPGRLSNQCDMYHFWSPHLGDGAHFLFTDGSVRFLGYAAAPVMPALASRAGGESVAPLD